MSSTSSIIKEVGDQAKNATKGFWPALLLIIVVAGLVYMNRQGEYRVALNPLKQVTSISLLIFSSDR